MKPYLLWALLVAILAGVANGNIAVLGGLAYEHTGAPGETYEGTIQVRNSGVSPCELRIYQSDYMFQASGETFYGDPGTTPRSNADWVLLNPRRSTIPGMSTGSIHYRVRVPADPDLSGSYWSMVMIEPMETDAQIISDKRGNGQMGVRTLVRYGVQIVTDIGDGGARDIRFRDTRLVEDGGRRLLEIDLENIGDMWLSPSFSVELYDEDGNHAFHFDSRQQRVYPGCSVRHRLDLASVPEGKYKALAIADNRDDYVFGAQYDLWIE
jgi:hypothetical protein